METRIRSSRAQYLLMLDFMESHGDIGRPRPGPQSRLRADLLWQVLADSLNALGGDVNKSPDKWKKVWADWKSKTKKKASKIRRHSVGTSGGPSNRTALTALETRVLALLGKAAIEGHSEIKEQGVNIPTLEEDVSNFVKDEMVTSLPDVVVELPLDHSTSQRLRPTPAPTQHSPQTVDSSSPTTQSLMSPSSTTSRRRRMPACRRWTLSPFDRAETKFAAIERRRLMLEERHERNEARRIEVEHERNLILDRFADIAEAISQHLLHSRDLTT